MLHIPELYPFETPLANTVHQERYAHTLDNGTLENWADTSFRVGKEVLSSVFAEESLIQKVIDNLGYRSFIAGGRYLNCSGRPRKVINNCFLLGVEDSKEGWAELYHNASLCLMNEGGIGVTYSKIRGKNKPIRGSGGVSSGPCPVMETVNQIGRATRRGGKGRSAIWAGLHWWHPDIFEFIEIKNWSPEIKRMKAKDFNFPAPMDTTNISVILDDDFFVAYQDPSDTWYEHAHQVYWSVIRRMLIDGEPGFSIDVGENAGEDKRNACTELTSADDSDCCNLSSINLSRISSSSHMKSIVDETSAFLVAGTVYSDLPYDKVYKVRQKNRRLGLGLMGIHEFVLSKGYKYGEFCPELDSLLKEYKKSTEYAHYWSDRWGLSKSVKTRAIAPNGSIGILGETTTGAEPIFCGARKRRYAHGDSWHYQYVIDPTAQRMMSKGIPAELIEDAYTLASSIEGIERRISFQAYLQTFVDHGISSTINLPPWGGDTNNESFVKPFGELLLKYLPKLRGITVYPDGSRPGQPIIPVDLQTAVKFLGEVFVEGGEKAVLESSDVCDITKGGICGS